MTDVRCDREDCVYHKVESPEKHDAPGCMLAVVTLRNGRCADFKKRKLKNEDVTE
jgi:hypothetical protein